MKQNRLKSKGLLPALLLLLFGTTACLNETYDTNGSNNSGEKPVTFSLSLPGEVAGRSTYALTKTDEEEVSNVQVLLFSQEDLYLETRNVSNSEITSVGNKKRFTVQIPEGNYSSIVVLGNSADIISTAGLTTTDTKTATLGKLKISQSGVWITDKTKSSYRPIPMWGELGNTVVNQATSADSQSNPLALHLTRMLAKVSVALTSPTARSNFQLKSIQISNYYNQGYVAPLAANWGSGIATAASIPTGLIKQTNILSYSGAEITNPNVASTGAIYLFESDNAAQANSSARTCLVLGGIYIPDGKFYYYRIDFVDKANGTDRYIDLLRNHHYTFNVTRIDGPGYPTANEALLTKPYNIDASLVYWDDAAINHVATDERYMLGISQREYTYLLPAAHTAADNDNKLTIFTNHPNGWQIASITDNATGTTPNWLTLVTADQSGVTNSKKTVSLLLTKNTNEAAVFRSAQLMVQAGTLKMTVQVIQWHGYYPPKHSGWAGSNIYWDGTKLTFDDVDDQTHSTYQGIYFQWGSLTGISPVGNYDLTTLLYPPGFSTATGGTAWTAIPRVPDGTINSVPPLGKTERDRGYLYELDPATGTGDICKYITEQAGGTLHGKRWRMPTSMEFESATSYSKNDSFTNVVSTADDGTFAISQGYTKIEIGLPFFRAGGGRSESDGALLVVGKFGLYWSASPSNTQGYSLSFQSTQMLPGFQYNRGRGYSVRCVAE